MFILFHFFYIFVIIPLLQPTRPTWWPLF